MLPLLLTLACRTQAGPAPTTNIVVITWETTRADHTSLHGHPLRTTPGLELLATEGVSFQRNISAAPWTLPSVSSILTGRLPTGHGVREFEDVLVEGVDTLPERLQKAGYHTAMIGSNSIFEADRGLEQGFDHYFGQGDVPGEELAERMRTWLDERPQDQPFFLYMHLFEPHCPYDPPTRYQGVFEPWPAALATGRAWSQERWDQAFGCFRLPAPGRPGQPVLSVDPYLSAYDAELHYADHLTSLLVERLRTRGLLEQTLLVVVGDHGEEFLDHGDHGHGRHLYEESVHVPLLIRPPGGAGSAAGRKVQALTSSVDVTATALAAAGLPVDGDGRDLSPAWTGSVPSAWEQRAVYSGTDHEAHLRSVHRGSHKLIAEVAKVAVDPTDPGQVAPPLRPPELYDLSSDPDERTNLATSQPALLAELKALLLAQEEAGRAQAAQSGRARRALDAETEEALKRLGYLEE